MSSEVKANKISPATGTAFTFGDSGDTFTVPSGATITNSGTANGFGGDNTPRFQAYLSANQDPAASTWVKVQFNAELYDTDGAYDPTTNYRFTVPTGEGGTYFLYSNVTGGSQVSGNVSYFQIVFYKNGANFTGSPAALMNSAAASYQTAKSIQTILTLVADDYIEVYGQISEAGGNARYRGPDTMAYCSFGGYKLL